MPPLNRLRHRFLSPAPAVPGPGLPPSHLRARLLELAPLAPLLFNEAFINLAGQPATPKTGAEFFIPGLIGPPTPTDFFRAALRGQIRFRM